MPNHCSGSGQRFTAKHVLIPRCRRGMLLTLQSDEDAGEGDASIPTTRPHLSRPYGYPSLQGCRLLSAAHHLIALEFALVEYHQCAVQNAFTIVAAGTNANGAPDLAPCMLLVHLPMQSRPRLVSTDSCRHSP